MAMIRHHLISRTPRYLKRKFLLCWIGCTAVISVTVAVWTFNRQDISVTNIYVPKRRDFLNGQVADFKPKDARQAAAAADTNTFFAGGLPQAKALHNLTVRKEETPIILSWDNFGLSMERNISCNTHKCFVTGNREVRHQHDVLAILFSGTQFASSGLPLPRKPGHLWSLIHNESPKNNDWLFSAQGAMGLFNLTSTFKRESHYPTPTFWLRAEADLLSMEFVLPVQKKNYLRRYGLAPVIYVHSDCHVPSDRDHYMRLLHKHIDIDSYGECEHNKDFPFKNLTGLLKLHSRDFLKLVSKYKFAFAFENGVCNDYITEKFWRAFKLGVVPITFGSPTLKDFAPSNYSIIDIRDFRSVKELADYITFLDTNDREYSKYTDYKRTGITNPYLKSQLAKRDWGVDKPHSSLISGFECFVCEKLHRLKQQVLNGQYIEQWQGKDDHFSCPLPKMFDKEGNYRSYFPAWSTVTDYAKYYLQSLRYHIDNGINADIKEIHKYARNLQKKYNQAKDSR